MNKYIFTIVVTWSIMFYCSCTYSESVINKAPLVLDLDKAQNKGKLNVSQLFEKGKVILLDSCSEALLGEISQVSIVDGNIFVLDRNIAKTVFMFDKTGKFIRRIGGKGIGKGEYISPFEFSIDKSRHHIFVLDRQPRRILEYDYTTGNYINSVSIPQISNHLLYYSDKLYLDCPQRGGKNLIYRTSIKGEDKDFLLSPEYHNKGWDFALANKDGVFSSRHSDIPMITHLFMDTVFCINKHKLYPYMVIRSKEMMTKDDIRDLDVDNNPLDLVKLIKRNKYFNIQTYMDVNDFIFFQMEKDIKLYSFFYDKIQQQLFKYDSLNEDILSDGVNLQMLGFQFGGYDSKGVWFYLFPNQHSQLYHLKYQNNEENFNGAVIYYEYKK